MRTLLALLLTVLVITGCAAPKSVAAKPGDTVAPSSATGGGEKTGEPEGENTTKVGEWAEADDGVRFRVSKLARGKVGAYASGGKPGAPAVVVTVQIQNGSKQRFDLTLSTVTTRLGKDGREAEEVFSDGYGGTPDGSLAHGRVSTHKYMFAAEDAAELKTVAVEIAPGLEYDSFTFEGAAA